MSLAHARILVFVTSAIVLVLEILAGRLLAPYVGVSLETFTGIIGTILAGIALGSWLGGIAADRYPPHRLLGPLIMVGGVFSLLAPTIITVFGPGMQGGRPLEIVLLTTLGFFIPAVLLSGVTPVVIKIRLQSLEETGAVVGSFSALSTAGAIVGTFLTGFVLLAAFPSRPIVLVVGGILVAWGLALTITYSALKSTVTGALVAGSLLAGGLSVAVTGPCQFETAYFCARITVDEFTPSARALWLDTLRHSYVDLDDPTYLEFRYTNLTADATRSLGPDGPLDALYIGGGGFTLPRWLSAERPGSTNTVLELDPELVTISEQELGLDPDEIDVIATGDARMTLLDTPLDTFELVVGDAFGGPSVPWHLTTQEFLVEVRDRMSEDGIYVMNVIDYPPHSFAKAEAATLRSVFDHVMVVAPPAYLEGTGGGNFVLIASNTPLDPDALIAEATARGADEAALIGAELDAWIGDAPILVDDFAPVDQLISRP